VLVAFHPEALAELQAVAARYEAEVPALGSAFVAEVRRAEGRLARFPLAGAPLRGETRRLLLRRFPHGLVYRAEPERVFILAVAHVRRRPGYWRSRR
jgi:plasmid stabilization system protein ParE